MHQRVSITKFPSVRLACISLRAGLHAFERKSRRKPPGETNHLRCNLTEGANIDGRKRGGEGLAKGRHFYIFVKNPCIESRKNANKKTISTTTQLRVKKPFLSRESGKRQIKKKKEGWGHKDRATRLWIW